MSSRLFCLAVLLIAGGGLCLGGSFVNGTEHPNYWAQIPHGSGVLGELEEQQENPFLALLKQYPQYDIIIDWERRLIGFFDPKNPGKAIVWTPFPFDLYTSPENVNMIYSLSDDPIIEPVDDPVPEPSSLALMPLGLAALWAARRASRRVR